MQHQHYTKIRIQNIVDYDTPSFVFVHMPVNRNKHSVRTSYYLFPLIRLVETTGKQGFRLSQVNVRHHDTNP